MEGKTETHESTEKAKLMPVRVSSNLENVVSGCGLAWTVCREGFPGTWDSRKRRGSGSVQRELFGWNAGKGSGKESWCQILRGLGFQVREVWLQVVGSWERLRRNWSGQRVLRKRQALAWNFWCSEDCTK